MMKRILIPVLAAAWMAAFAAAAAGLVDTTQAVAIVERHVYDEGGEEALIPQSGAEQHHLLSQGAPLMLETRDFPGFAPLEGPTQVHVLVQEDETVVFHYARTTAPVTATVRLEATEDSNLPYLRQQLSGRRVSLKTRQDTVATLPMTLEEDGEGGLEATLDFGDVYTHTPSGSAHAYRVLLENPPLGFVSASEGLRLTLQPVPLTLDIRHLYEAGEGMEPIPQPGAETEIEVRYGDTLLVPNQDFEGFLADQETPNQYVSAVTGEMELSFFHRRRMGVYGQIALDTSLSNRPNRLVRLLPEEMPVLLSLHGQTAGAATAQFSGQEPMASVSFPHAYTHTPEGTPLSYALSLDFELPGFITWADGTDLLLTPESVSITVIHQYEARPGVWETIPQEGASATERARFGDALTVAGRDFDGFAKDPEDVRELSQITGAEEVIFQHVRAYGDLSCELRLEGGPDSNRTQMLTELATAYFTATGGELPEEGVRVNAALAGQDNDYLLRATLPSLPTHTPEGVAYDYALVLRGFPPLAGAASIDLQAGVPVSVSMKLPEVPITCLLQAIGADDQSYPIEPVEGLVCSYPYGERVALAPPALPGYTPLNSPLSIDFLSEAVTYTFAYHPDGTPTQ